MEEDGGMAVSFRLLCVRRAGSKLVQKLIGVALCRYLSGGFKPCALVCHCFADCGVLGAVQCGWVHVFNFVKGG